MTHYQNAFFFLTNKDMYISLFYQNKHMINLYKMMIKKLKYKLEKLGEQNGVSKENIKKYLHGCEKNLSNTLQV